jgi:hypothetical protein
VCVPLHLRGPFASREGRVVLFGGGGKAVLYYVLVGATNRFLDTASAPNLTQEHPGTSSTGDLRIYGQSGLGVARRMVPLFVQPGACGCGWAGLDQLDCVEMRGRVSWMYVYIIVVVLDNLQCARAQVQ